MMTSFTDEPVQDADSDSVKRIAVSESTEEATTPPRKNNVALSTESNLSNKSALAISPSSVQGLFPSNDDRNDGPQATAAEQKDNAQLPLPLQLHHPKQDTLHILADQVRSLTEELHSRDRQIRGMKEKVTRCTDMEKQLETKQRLLNDTVKSNQGLRDMVYDLNVQLSSRELVNVSHTAAPPIPVQEAPRQHPRKLERDAALIQAGELSMKVASIRATEDELRDEIANQMSLIKQYYDAAVEQQNTLANRPRFPWRAHATAPWRVNSSTKPAPMPNWMQQALRDDVHYYLHDDDDDASARSANFPVHVTIHNRYADNSNDEDLLFSAAHNDDGLAL